MIRFTATVDQTYVAGEEFQFDPSIEEIYVQRGVAVFVESESTDSAQGPAARNSFEGARGDKMIHEGNRRAKQK